VAGLFAGRFTERGTERTAAVVGGSAAAVVVLALFVLDVVRLFADRRRLMDLALREVMAQSDEVE
jgi:hypothetical protein